MVPLMLFIDIHPRVSSATSAFNYIFISMTNLITLLIEKLLPLNVIILFSVLAVRYYIIINLKFFGGSIVTKIGYYLLEKFKVAWVAILIVLVLAIVNLISGVWYILIENSRFGFETLL